DAGERIEGQRRLEEQLRGALRHRHQLAERQLRQSRPRAGLIEQIAADQPQVGLADLGDRLPRPVMNGRGDIEALVRLALPQDRQMGHAAVRRWHQYTPSTTTVPSLAKGRTLRTPSHGYFAHGGSRSAESRSRKRGTKDSLVS